MSMSFDDYDLHRALRIRNEEVLAEFFEYDPVATLRQLDYAMRGLRE